MRNLGVLMDAGYEILAFTISSEESIVNATSQGVTGFYIDTLEILPKNED